MRLKGITSSKDTEAAKSVTSSRLTKYMKKGAKMKKGSKIMKKGSVMSKGGDCGCGGGKIIVKKQLGGSFKPVVPVSRPINPLQVNNRVRAAKMMPAYMDPRNATNPKDQFVGTNLSVKAKTQPTMLNLQGPAFKGYKQGRAINGVPSINYSGAGTSRYSGRANQGVLARYLGRSNQGLKAVYINGKKVLVR